MDRWYESSNLQRFENRSHPPDSCVQRLPGVILTIRLSERIDLGHHFAKTPRKYPGKGSAPGTDASTAENVINAARLPGCGLQPYPELQGRRVPPKEARDAPHLWLLWKGMLTPRD